MEVKINKVLPFFSVNFLLSKITLHSVVNKVREEKENTLGKPPQKMARRKKRSFQMSVPQRCIVRLCRSIPSLFLNILKYQHNNKKQQITKITLTSTPLRFDKLLFSSSFFFFFVLFLEFRKKVRFILPPSLKSAGKRKISFFPDNFQFTLGSPRRKIAHFHLVLSLPHTSGS